MIKYILCLIPFFCFGQTYTKYNINGSNGLPSSEFVATNSKYSDIHQAKPDPLSVGDKFETFGLNNSTDGGGGTYVVSATPLADFAPDGYAQFQLANGLYAILEPQDGCLRVEQFGAVAGDGLDDSDEIQLAIDWALTPSIKASAVQFGSGVYDLDKGLVVARRTGAEYDFVTCALKGANPVYDNLNALTILEVNNVDGFGVAIQRGRKIHVENIRFRGFIPIAGTHENIVTWNIGAWTSGGFRNNIRSPYSGIVIDPFHADDFAQAYPDFTGNYTNSSTGGTSMVTITGCSFDQLLVGIMHNPSSRVQNGDNVNVINCNVNRCRTFFASGQDQSRANRIEGCYVLSTRTTMDGRTYGNSIGSLPVLSNCNIAGGSKYLYVTNSGPRADVRISETYAESLWALGVGNGIPHFDQSTLKFSTSYSDWRPTFVAEEAHFTDCKIQYYGSGPSIPFPFAGQVSFDNCYIDGGLPYRQFTNSGGEEFNMISYDNVFFEDKGQYVANNARGIPTVNMWRHPVVNELTDNRNSRFIHRAGLYQTIYMGNKTVGIDGVRYYIVDTNSENYKVGDQVSTLTQNYSASSMDGSDIATFRSTLGVVESISGDTIYLTGSPEGLSPGSYDISIYDLPYVTRVIGTTTAGSNIMNIISADNSCLRNGYRINGTGIAPGTYIVSFSGTQITMSSNATSSVTNGYFEGADIVMQTEAHPYNGYIYKRGDRLFPKDATAANPRYTTTDFGKPASAKTPVFN